jgi:FkbM family methyltransferase
MAISLMEIARNYQTHSRQSVWWNNQALKARNEFHQLLTGKTDFNSIDCITELQPFNFPYHKMGKVDSIDLFGLDELIIFSWYYKNRNLYKKTLDLGGNIGLHSLIMTLFGFRVTSFEPDPAHLAVFRNILSANEISNVDINQTAVGTANGSATFIRVTGNTTGSHLKGARDTHPYGGHEEFEVAVKNINDLLDSQYDFIKMDVEGLEADLFEVMDLEKLGTTDIMVEIGNEKNRERVWNKLNKSGLQLFSQKVNWEKATKLDDLPASYKEGSLFISNSEMSWGN